MKRIYTILVALVLTAGVFAQAPHKMSYQAVIRNASNALVTNHAIGMRISILQGSGSGTAVYAETQTATTNANGLVSIVIGTGSIVSGTIDSIDWSNGPYFIKTETDPAGGVAYNISGVSQLLSVPYALSSKGLTLPYSNTGSYLTSPFSLENTGPAYYTIKGLSTSGYGIYGKSSAINAAGILGEGKGSDYSAGIIGCTGEGITPTLPGNCGVLGQADTNFGVAGTALSGIGGYFTSPTGLALKTLGNIQLTGIGESAGKVLTSDSAGNASWQDDTTGLILPYSKTATSAVPAFEVINTNASGIRGVCSSSSGSGNGVEGESSSSDGCGVLGNGNILGVKGTSSNNQGIGILGEAPYVAIKGLSTASTGITYGVYGSAISNYGYGIYGMSPYVGVYGYATNSSGWAGYFSGKVGISGYLGIGTAYPAYTLEVAGTANLNYNTTGVALRCNGAEAIWYNGTYFSWGFGGTYNYFGDKIFIGAVAADPGTNLLVVNGAAAKPGGGSWATWSDARLKDLHGSYNKGLKEIMLLQPVNYSYKKDNSRLLPSDKTYVGFVAQDVQKVFPESVTAEPDGYLILDMNAINIALINAVKELKSENDNLKVANDELKTRVEKLEKLINK